MPEETGSIRYRGPCTSVRSLRGDTFTANELMAAGSGEVTHLHCKDVFSAHLAKIRG